MRSGRYKELTYALPRTLLNSPRLHNSRSNRESIHFLRKPADLLHYCRFEPKQENTIRGGSEEADQQDEAATFMIHALWSSYWDGFRLKMAVILVVMVLWVGENQMDRSGWSFYSIRRKPDQKLFISKTYENNSWHLVVATEAARNARRGQVLPRALVISAGKTGSIFIHSMWAGAVG